jgi:hypothetical protein
MAWIGLDVALGAGWMDKRARLEFAWEEGEVGERSCMPLWLRKDHA